MMTFKRALVAPLLPLLVAIDWLLWNAGLSWMYGFRSLAQCWADHVRQWRGG